MNRENLLDRFTSLMRSARERPASEWADENRELFEQISQMDPIEVREQLTGKPGEPVPEVDPQDVKAAWEWTRDNPGKQSGLGVLLSGEMKLGANPFAAGHRAAMLSLLPHFEPEFSKDGQLDEGVFYAAARVPMQWLGVGTQGPPFDEDEFVRLATGHRA